MTCKIYFIWSICIPSLLKGPNPLSFIRSCACALSCHATPYVRLWPMEIHPPDREWADPLRIGGDNASSRLYKIPPCCAVVILRIELLVCSVKYLPCHFARVQINKYGSFRGLWKLVIVRTQLRRGPRGNFPSLPPAWKVEIARLELGRCMHE